MFGQESAVGLMNSAFELSSLTIAACIYVFEAAICRVRRLASFRVVIVDNRRLSEVRNQVSTHDYLCENRAGHVRSLKKS